MTTNRERVLRSLDFVDLAESGEALRVIRAGSPRTKRGGQSGVAQEVLGQLCEIRRFLASSQIYERVQGLPWKEYGEAIRDESRVWPNAENHSLLALLSADRGGDPIKPWWEEWQRKAKLLAPFEVATVPAWLDVCLQKLRDERLGRLAAAIHPYTDSQSLMPFAQNEAIYWLKTRGAALREEKIDAEKDAKSCTSFRVRRHRVFERKSKLVAELEEHEARVFAAVENRFEAEHQQWGAQLRDRSPVTWQKAIDELAANIRSGQHERVYANLHNFLDFENERWCGPVAEILELAGRAFRQTNVVGRAVRKRTKEALIYFARISEQERMTNRVRREYLPGARLGR